MGILSCAFCVLNNKEDECTEKLTLCSMSEMMSLTSAICFLVDSLSSGECRVASSTSLPCSLSFVLAIAASSSAAASSRRLWSTGLGPALSVSSSDVVVTEANSRARDSLKCASATISDSSGKSCCLYLREARESVMALGYLRNLSAPSPPLS